MQHAALGADDTVLQKTPFSFDVSVWELFWPLVTGARLVFARPGGQRETDYGRSSSANGSPRSISCRRCCVRSSIIPTSTRTAHRCAASYAAAKRCPDLQQRCLERLDVKLYNLYGPTEAAVDVTAWECRRDDPHRIVPIGRPIANTRLYIVDAQMQPTPVGVPELLIGGTPVGRGYHGEPELSAESSSPIRSPPTRSRASTAPAISRATAPTATSSSSAASITRSSCVACASNPVKSRPR